MKIVAEIFFFFQIAQILRNIGVHIPDNHFETLWDVATKIHPKGEVSIETIKSVLDDMHTNPILLS